MSLKCGIVGLPNVGKSTLFNALTSAGIEAQNFPFCTIEPNQGVVPVPDKRLDKIAEIVMPEKVIPTTTEFVDIAGLVEGASKGEGLGNKFLSHIRETQAIIHVIRCFEDEDITHVHKVIDPISDLEIIETELLLADIETVSRAKEKVERLAKSGVVNVKNEYDLLSKLEEDLNKGTLARDSKVILDNEFKDLHLITQKPCLYLANIKEDEENNRHLLKLTEYADSRSSKVLPLCNQIESEISELEVNEREEFLKDMGMEEPGLNKLIRKSYELLELQTFFTAGKKEARAWTIRKGSKAPQAAGEIHTDFERGFIKADTISYKDYIQFNGEAGCKEAGKLRSEGSDYEVKDGDVIHFKFNV